MNQVGFQLGSALASMLLYILKNTSSFARVCSCVVAKRKNTETALCFLIVDKTGKCVDRSSSATQSLSVPTTSLLNLGQKSNPVVNIGKTFHARLWRIANIYYRVKLLT